MFNPFEQPPKIETPPKEKRKVEQPEKEEENKEIKEEFPFESEQKVRVKRSSGEFEDDWQFAFFDPRNDERVIVLKKEGGKEITKSVDINKLKSWQEKPAGKKEEESKEIKEKASEKESPKIELPRNFKTIERLQDKLKDYKQRLESKKDKVDPYKAPEQTFRVFAGTKYKIAVVEKLLLEGNVDTHQLSLELGEKDGQFDKQAFENACSVIKDYVTTGGKRVTGGTGF